MAWYKAGGGSKPKQSKTVTPSTGVQEITADSGKELEKVTVQAMPSGALKTPTVNASGLVTSGVQTSGYIGTSAESTLQLPTQGARTFTPTITNTTLVSSGKYTTGAIICKGDANLKAENIAKGKTIFNVNGTYSPTGDYIWEKSTYKDGFKISEKKISSLPYNVSEEIFVAYNGQIHLFGGINYTNYWRTWDGSNWITNGNAPYSQRGGSAVVFNGRLHLLGGYGAAKTHMSYDGTSWRTETSIPVDFYYGQAVVYDNAIHIMGGSPNTRTHYKYQDGTWTNLYNSANPHHALTHGASCVCDNKIYIFGGDNSYNSYSVYDGTSWTVATMPFNISVYGFATSNGNQMLVLSADNYIYQFDGTTWTNKGNLSFKPYAYAFMGTVLDNHIYLAMAKSSSNVSDGFVELGTAQYVADVHIGYVIGANESEFPNGGLYNNEYYELVDLNSYAMGTFTIASDGTNQTITIPHDLGRIPEKFIIVPTTSPTYSSSYECILYVFNNYVLQWKNQYGQKPTFYDNKNYTANEQIITIGGYWLGATYTWLAI